MMECSSCARGFDGAGWICPDCGHAPELRDGIPIFAPGLAGADNPYDAALFEGLDRVEAGNFWFRSRRQLLVDRLQRHFPGARRYLEIGVGSGFVLEGVRAACPDLAAWATETRPEPLLGLRRAGRAGDAVLFQMDARRIPFLDHFDVIGAFDVLEHVLEDVQALAQIRRALRPGGGVILTVPQHAFLWSPADTLAHHVRRYAPGELEDKVAAAGLTVEFSTSFVALLLPALLASRWRTRRHGRYEPQTEFAMPAGLNAALAAIMAAERRLIGWGVRFPAGGSRLVVARRN